MTDRHPALDQVGCLCAAMSIAAQVDGLPCELSATALHQRFAGPSPEDTIWLLRNRWALVVHRAADHGLHLVRYAPPLPGRPGMIELRAPAPARHLRAAS